MTIKFHVEDRGSGHVLAAGLISEDNLVTWTEVDESVTGEAANLAQQIQQDVTEGYSGGQLRPPLEWFAL